MFFSSVFLGFFRYIARVAATWRQWPITSADCSISHPDIVPTKQESVYLRAPRCRALSGLQDSATYDRYIVGLTAAHALAGEAPVLTEEEQTHVEVGTDQRSSTCDPCMISHGYAHPLTACDPESGTRGTCQGA